MVVVGVMGGLSSKTAEVQKNDNAAFLPKTAEATVVLELNKKFVDSTRSCPRCSSTGATPA